ncbi:spindle assembly abnormal protein 6 [Histomonas meleagridis]|uniref:spindle assembly abnormal protein 6-like n=1 Tax=Histomonas meleagridis TaxID=135588 RepID=UPI003559EEDB|nr:spindle assembly abnormal protein 6 [Histomonas meleagridis]KAH0806088.1 spindle assembly abnormal protein 6-like [Histomonas meleagridis]
MSNKQITVRTEIVQEDGTILVRDLFYLFSKTIPAGGEFELQITDPKNPLLLFDYRLKSNEFPNLRERLQLFCEFTSFPNSLFDILSQCQSSDDYKAVIDCKNYDQPQLLLQQMTRISLLTHIRVTLIPASDARLKNHLAKETKFYKKSYEQSQEQIKKLELQIQNHTADFAHELDDKEEKLNEQKLKYKEQIQQIKQEYENKIEELQHLHEESQKEQQQKYEKQSQIISDQYQKEQENMQTQYQKLLEEKHQLVAQHEREEEKINSLEKQIATLKDSQQEKDQIIKETQQTNKNIMTENTKLQTEVATLQTKLQTIEENHQQKNVIIDQNDQLLKDLREELKAKEQELQQCKESLQEQKQRASERDWIAEKSRKVIAKHQEDIKKLVQHHNERKAEWEKQMQEKKQIEIEQARLQETIKAYKVEMQHQQEKITNLENKCKSLETLNEEMKKTEEENMHMIEYLEKSLNNKCAMEFEVDGIDFSENETNPQNTTITEIKTEETDKTENTNTFNYQETTSLFDTPLAFY